MIGSLNLQMETSANSVIGDPSLKRMVVTEERPSVWNATYSSFFPNEVSSLPTLSLSGSHFTAYSLVLRLECIAYFFVECFI